MRPRNRSIDIFNLSMLDTISGALGAFLIIMLVLMRFHQPEVAKENVQLRKDVEASKQAASEASARVAELQQALQALEGIRAERDAASSALAEANARAEQLEQRLGIALNETEIVFVLDVSGSMRPAEAQDDRSKDLLSQVISGIKMLVATMTDQYSIDVIIFPGPNGTHSAMWGQLRPITDDSKYEVYRYLEGLRAGGGTPTGEAMRAALAQYADAKTIVLLSDGEPCQPVGNNCQALSRDQLGALTTELTTVNAGRKTINTIGVGAPFRVRNSDANAVTFLRSLAERNRGFYIGF